MEPNLKNLKILLILILTAIALPTLGKEKKVNVTKKVITKKNTALKKKRIGVDQSDFMPSANNFGLIASYGLTYNELEEVERKTVNHFISLAGTYSFDKHWSSYLSSAVSYQTYNNNVFRENESDQYYNMSNTNLGVVYSKMRPLSFVRRSSNTLNFSLPTSERSQVDNHVMAISLSNFMSSYSWKRFSLFNRLHANFLWNQERFSRTTDLVNRDWLVSNSTGLTYLITNKFGVRASFRANYTRYISGEWIQGFGNGVSLFGNLGGFQVYASMVNNAYPENERLDVFFFDEYRRLYSMGVTYAF